MMIDVKVVFGCATTSALRRDGMIIVHRADCREVSDTNRYPHVDREFMPASTTGREVIVAWYDDGILDEITTEYTPTYGQGARERAITELATQLDVSGCVSKRTA